MSSCVDTFARTRYLVDGWFEGTLTCKSFWRAAASSSSPRRLGGTDAVLSRRSPSDGGAACAEGLRLRCRCLADVHSDFAASCILALAFSCFFWRRRWRLRKLLPSDPCSSGVRNNFLRCLGYFWVEKTIQRPSPPCKRVAGARCVTKLLSRPSLNVS